MAADQKGKQQELTFGEKVEKFQTFIMFDLGGPKVNLFRIQLDLFKGLTWLWVLFLMDYYQNYSTGMYLYLFLHGTYGICWVIKDFWFPDARYLTKSSICSQIGLFILLTSYWTIPLPLAAGLGIDNPSQSRIIFLVVMYITGVILMMGADYQKTTTLRRKKGLISDGFFKYTRNPNYLGETFIYTSFVLCAGHFWGFLVFYTLGGFLFAMNIYVKEECSYKKKQGWDQYSKRSYILFPKIFQTFALNTVFYAVSFIAVFYFLAQETSPTFFYPLNTLI